MRNPKRYNTLYSVPSTPYNTPVSEVIRSTLIFLALLLWFNGSCCLLGLLRVCPCLKQSSTGDGIAFLRDSLDAGVPGMMPYDC